MKRYTVVTLVDITETRQYRKEDNNNISHKQQQNFVTLLQSVGMRVNPLYETSPKQELIDIASYNFGTEFRGKHNVWSWTFAIEYADGFTDSKGNETGLLIDDLNFVPIITGLTETATFAKPMFDSKSSQHCNIIVINSNDK
jgi:hypothetical protein